MADHVAILDNGVIVKTGRTEELRDSVRRFIFTPASEADVERIPGVLDVIRSSNSVSVTVEDCADEKRHRIKALSANSLTTEAALNLDEIFEAYVIGNRGRAPAM
ncbi:MAG: hypothetical protein IH624_14225 [Phycisphaerae bacterium]|nr:hypothetical protein [Phycisphaerae bacterium]